jgi:DNA-binding HxlR family transcriptional regulator/putative sterol carrier protein
VARSYDQYCGLAKALEVVGGRWTLLVVRELLTGPKRYSDLLAGIPGISTDLLAARLRDLEAADLVLKRTLPPPAASTVYEVTEFGRGLARPVGALAAWGTSLLGARQPHEAFRASWLVLPLRAMFRPELTQEVELCCQYRVGGDTATLRIAGGQIDILEGPAPEPDVVITTDPETLLRIGNRTLPVETALAEGRLQVEGNRDAIETLTRAFGLAG